MWQDWQKYQPYWSECRFAALFVMWGMGLGAYQGGVLMLGFLAIIEGNPMAQSMSCRTSLLWSNTVVGLAFHLSYFVMWLRGWRQARVHGHLASMLLHALLFADPGEKCVKKLSKVQSSLGSLLSPSLWNRHVFLWSLFCFKLVSPKLLRKFWFLKQLLDFFIRSIIYVSKFT